MPEKGMRKCIFAAAAAVAVLLSDIGGTAVYAGENVPYETYNYDYYEDIKYTPAAYVPDGTVTGDAIEFFQSAGLKYRCRRKCLYRRYRK